MAQTRNAPSDNQFSHFRCEEATITDVNRKTWTVRAETRHTSKIVDDIQCLVPYHHFRNGEGIHFLPEVGAVCMIGFPSDNTPPFIMGFKGAAGVLESEDGDPIRPTVDAEGSNTDVTFRSRRPALNPGDIGITSRDENFLLLRRGGVLQLGATPISQRVYIPVLNFIRDFCENYSMEAFGGDVSWTVERQEDDPSGLAPATYVFHCNTNAQDAKASVRVRHMALAVPGSANRTAWEVQVAPLGIDRETGEVSGPVYTLDVTTGGDQTEFIKGSREITINGSDKLTVSSSLTVDVGSNYKLTVGGNMELIATGQAVIDGALVKLGGPGAVQPAIPGAAFVTWLGTAKIIPGPAGPTGPYTVDPSDIAKLTALLSKKVFVT